MLDRLREEALEAGGEMISRMRHGSWDAFQQYSGASSPWRAATASHSSAVS
jgi:hypothetical protein